MYYGGSNFFWQAALGNPGFGENYKPFLPSYDYDAPLTEAGDFTDKFVRVRDVIAKYLPVRAIPVKESPKLGLGPVTFRQSVSLAAAPEVVSRVVETDDPLTLEELGVPYGFALYETTANVGGFLSAWVYDHGVLSINGAPPSAKSFRPSALNGTVRAGDRISILTTSLGRYNASPHMFKDRKGLREIKIAGSLAKKWRTSTIPLDSFNYNVKWDTKLVVGVPAFYRAQFDIDEPADTFLNGDGFDIAVFFVNGIYVGRYWKIGPQKTLYVRAQYLKKGLNELVAFETGSITTVPSVTFDTKPILDGPATPIAQA
jgi:beta-galactosidase